MHINTCILQAHGTPNHASLSLSRHEQVPVNLSHMLGSAEGRAGNVKQRGAEQQRGGALEVARDSEGAREVCVHIYICVFICIYIHIEGDTYIYMPNVSANCVCIYMYVYMYVYMCI